MAATNAVEHNSHAETSLMKFMMLTFVLSILRCTQLQLYGHSMAVQLYCVIPIGICNIHSTLMDQILETPIHLVESTLSAAVRQTCQFWSNGRFHHVYWIFVVVLHFNLAFNYNTLSWLCMVKYEWKIRKLMWIQQYGQCFALSTGRTMLPSAGQD